MAAVTDGCWEQPRIIATPRGQDWQPHPCRHHRLLARTLILGSGASAVSSPSVLLDPPRSAGGELPWPDPQRWLVRPVGYLASAPLGLEPGERSGVSPEA